MRHPFALKTDLEFANLGISAVAYVRRVERRELTELEIDPEDVAPDVDLWGLYGADGAPLAIADDRSDLIADASERDLVPVYLQ